VKKTRNASKSPGIAARYIVLRQPMAAARNPPSISASVTPTTPPVEWMPNARGRLSGET
jgi:hypothetical protein